MSDSESRLPAHPSFEQLQKQAKELLRQCRAKDEAALQRLQTPNPKLADAQFVVAREHGFDSWAKLKQHLEAAGAPDPARFEQLAQQLATFYMAGDASAIREINWTQGTSFFCDGDPQRMRERLPTWLAAPDPTPGLALADARLLVARAYGFESWTALMQRVRRPSAPGTRDLASSPPVYRIDWTERIMHPVSILADRDWDVVFAAMKDHGITRLNAGGRMTVPALERLCRMEHLTRLDLGNSVQLTDHSLAHLSRLHQLEELDLSGWKGGITDRGLEFLSRLPELKRFQMCWQQNVTDAGFANLANCDQLEDVNLLGTFAGDGAIRALAGKPNLRGFTTGRSVTDAGIPLLHEFPVYKTWQGGDAPLDIMTFDASPNKLILDGPFTNAGLASLAGLDGLFGLTFFWHCSAFTSEGLRPLRDLANLGFVGCQDEHCDDEAMRQIAAIPRLRMLMGQGAVATDDGWEALSKSQTLEHIWGRECPNLTGRGFAALARLPALRGLAVSCAKVDDAALSTLPSFPSLRQLTPMEVSDDGFRHVGNCRQLEGLWCMYCRDTGDAATGHLARLSLKTYYAGSTRITDRSLEILAGMQSLEKIELWQCTGVTDIGIAKLAALPALKEISMHGLPGVTRAATRLFRPPIRINFTT